MSELRGTVVPPGETRPVAARIRVGADGVTAVRDDGVAHGVAYDGMTLELGGYEGDFLFCRPADGSVTIASNDPAFVAALREAGGARLASRLAAVGDQKRKRRIGGWVSAGAFFALVAGAAVLLWNVPSMVAGSVEALPTSVDRQLGDAAMGDLSSMGEPVHEPAVQAFLDEVIARLEPHARGEGWDFRVLVVESEQVNAFALPGGQMVVFTGLLREAERPEQVAGVMAHEMAHVTRRHGMRNVAHRVGIVLGLQLLLGEVEGWVALGAELAIVAKSNDYSREQEADADADGTRMLMAAGLDPEGLAEFFQLLEQQPGTELGGAMTWLSTHPEHRARIAHVRELAATLPAAEPRPLATDWSALKAALR